MLKRATITPIFKEGDPFSIENYRPFSILPTVSKVFEKIIAQQLRSFLECRFSNMLSGFRKGYSTQHALLRLLHKWQKALDSSNIVGTVLMDLSKAYDSLPHDQMIAKLAAYGLSYDSLLFIYNYLKHRQHRVKIGNQLSKFLCIILGIPQGSILGPLRFNLFINDLLFFAPDSEICNFADDNTLYTCAKSVDNVLSTLKDEVEDIIYWFEINSLAANPAKFQVMLLGAKEHISHFRIGNISVEIKDYVKLLGIHIDNKLRFNEYVDKKCQKASNKIKALRRIRPFLSFEAANSLCNAFIFSNFNYCPLIWMNFIKTNNLKIDKIQRRALSVHSLSKLFVKFTRTSNII